MSKKQEGTGIPPQHAKTARAGGPGTGIDRKLHDPVQDKLSPAFPLDLSKAKSISDLMRGKIELFSVDGLIAMLGHAGMSVTIQVKSAA